jgi:hypothetical protein
MKEGSASSQEATARRALQELSRLASEARDHIDAGEYVEAASSLSAMPTVMGPLMAFVSLQWLETETSDPPAPPEPLTGTYL